ncbi:MAG: hypothetical protein GX240_00430 [Candidatus Atribacteria bacterium]|jgi:aldehyde:ferredoxin oxidoreductase|nr:hypothetical protein [Candidatus Atribacteria bacterium]
MSAEGLAAKLLYDNLKPGLDPFSERNILVFAAGPLTGTKAAPCSGRLVIGFKSPLTGTIGISNSGGYLAPMIKRSGWDAIVAEGKSSSLVYLYVNDDKVEFKDAAYLWGMSSGDTEDKIREELQSPKVRIAEIGPAGENKVLMSAVMVDKTRAAVVAVPVQLWAARI